MNLAIEYLVRKGLTKSLLRTPCSLFYNQVGNRRGRVIAIHSKGNGYVIKHWCLSVGLPNRALPPMKEFYSADPFTDPNVILSSPNYSLLPYREKSIPDCQNDWRNPMPEYLYDSFCDSFLCSISHQRARRSWLWDAFIHTYPPQLWVHKEMAFVRESQPAKWKRWKLWQKHMEFDSPHAELIFCN